MEDLGDHEENHLDEVAGVKVWLECILNNGRRGIWNNIVMKNNVFKQFCFKELQNINVDVAENTQKVCVFSFFVSFCKNGRTNTGLYDY